MFNINFDLNLIMVPLVLILLAILLLDKYVFKQRKTKGKGNEQFIINIAYEFLPILAFFVLFRSFVFDYNKIPSGSMEPTLYDGDHIFVNKFIYGVKLPLLHTKIVPVSHPKRGDVVVFRYPYKPNIYYIKRAIGLPGDTITYDKGVLSVNGKPLETKVNDTVTSDDYINVLSEIIEGKSHLIKYINGVSVEQHAQFLQEQNPNVLPMNLPIYWQVKVPAGQYFMMGDNRDQSADSRFWGFVPEKHIAGKASFMFMHRKSGLPSFKNATSIH